MPPASAGGSGRCTALRTEVRSFLVAHVIPNEARNLYPWRPNSYCPRIREGLKKLAYAIMGPPKLERLGYGSALARPCYDQAVAMIYSLGITITAFILILAFFVAVSLLARRVAHSDGLGTLKGWRWYPSPLALMVLIPILAVLVVRAAPLLFALPLIIPMLWRSRRLAGALMFIWNLGRKARGDTGDGSIEGQYRRIRDD